MGDENSKWQGRRNGEGRVRLNFPDIVTDNGYAL